jgi:hypothetical protein
VTPEIYIKRYLLLTLLLKTKTLLLFRKRKSGGSLNSLRGIKPLAAFYPVWCNKSFPVVKNFVCLKSR